MSYWGELLESAGSQKTSFENKNLKRMGTMAFIRTVFGGMKLALAVLIALKVFEVI